MQNCRSLAKNLPLFQSFVYASDFQIIGLSETWLHEAIADLEILPQGYTMFRKDRGSRGGGVMLAISDNLPSKQIPSPRNLEVVNVSASFNDSDVIFCMVYAPPNATADYHKDLSDYLATTTTLSNPVFILGDFNLPDINWATFTGRTLISNNFCDSIFESNFTQLVESPTHTCGNILARPCVNK